MQDSVLQKKERKQENCQKQKAWKEEVPEEGEMVETERRRRSSCGDLWQSTEEKKEKKKIWEQKENRVGGPGDRHSSLAFFLLLASFFNQDF